MASFNFGPRNEYEKEVFAVEGFRIHLQHKLYTLMSIQGVTEKELAKRAGVSRKKVRSVFDSDCKMSVRVMAKLFYALGKEVSLELRDK